MNVPDAYYQFIMKYAPYFYVIPTAMTQDPPASQKDVTVADGSNFQVGYPVEIKDDAHSEWNEVAAINVNVLTMVNDLQYTYYVAKNGKVEGPDPAFGRGAFPAAFAIDFLYEAYSAKQFESQKTDIFNKIVSLADFILTQQWITPGSEAYGGFKSSETSDQYWSIDAGRCIPPLLKAYELTETASYLNAAKLAGATFLYNMQHRPSELGQHDKYYGGFARAIIVALGDAQSQVNQSSDDGRVHRVGGGYDYNSSSAWMGVYNGNEEKVCWRFQNVNIPKNARIISAKITFKPMDYINIEDAHLKIYGIDEANTETFLTNPFGRPHTSAAIDWDPEIWGHFPEYDPIETPDLSDIIAEIVSIEEWIAGNAIGFFIEDDGSVLPISDAEIHMYDANPAYGPILEVEYEERTWFPEMDVENLYDFIGLKMLAETYDTANKTKYETMMSDAVAFLRSGFEDLYLWFDPLPSGDGKWHRVGINETEIYDDPISFALLGLYTYEGWSLTCQNVYNFLQSIRADAAHPGYNPAICWPGYIDVVTRFAACTYYDAITSGILWKIRKNHDKSSLQFSMKIINKYQEEFMNWGPLFTDYSPITEQKAMANTAWLSLLFLNYEDPITRFTQILRAHGENVILYAVQQAADTISYAEAVDIKAIISPARIEELLIEPGYIIKDYLTIHVFAPIRHHDKVRRKGVDYEVLNIQEFAFQGDILYRKATLRRLLGA